MLSRAVEHIIKSRIDYRKAIILLGPRQVGKTMVITKIASAVDPGYLYVNGDDPATSMLWSNISQAVIFR